MSVSTGGLYSPDPFAILLPMRILAGVALGAALLSRPLPGQDVPPDEAVPPRVRQEVAVVATRLDVEAASSPP